MLLIFTLSMLVFRGSLLISLIGSHVQGSCITFWRCPPLSFGYRVYSDKWKCTKPLQVDMNHSTMLSLQAKYQHFRFHPAVLGFYRCTAERQHISMGGGNSFHSFQACDWQPTGNLCWKSKASGCAWLVWDLSHVLSMES